MLGFVMLVAQAIKAQNSMRKADSLSNEGRLDLALQEYKNVFLADTENYNAVYNIACISALIKEADSAFKYLYIAAATNTVEAPLCDPDFILLRKDKRWDDFENKLVALIQKKYDNPIVDEAYARKLWRMNALDQAYYRDIELLEKNRGNDSSAEKSLWQLKEELNKQNQKELELLIAKKAWPKISEVGHSAAGAAFLVIQHSDLAKQKKYLPIIKKLCEEQEAAWGSYALMYDRVQIGENKPQRYGSQVRYNDKAKEYELFPLEDESKVDEWRKEIGMLPLADYLLHWNIKWVPKNK